jgi:phosphonate metabolism protein PhnN/1,5-bisphosphokinase (PRPP-forming)
VGPSGAGKDSLLNGARQCLAGDNRYVFPARVINRPANASEAHVPVTTAQFQKMQTSGAFALDWEAHGLFYGFPTSMDDLIRSAKIVVVNASRRVVAEARARYASTRVIFVDCPVALRAERLAARGREAFEEIRSRLSRTVAEFEQKEADSVITNSGLLADGVEELVSHLVCLRR